MQKNTIDDDDARTPPGRSIAVQAAEPARTIVVNGREHAFAGDEIGRDELARLAFPHVAPVGGSALTVAYDNGPADAPSGLVAKGRTTRVLHGQTFSVSLTDRS